MRFPVQADVTPAVQIDGYAPLPQRPERLRPPRAPRLAVTARRLAEDALEILDARPFATLELGHALVPAERREVHRRAGLRRVPVGVEANLVFLECVDDVLPAAAFERAGLFADDLESGADALAAEPVGNVHRRVVAGGE